MGKKNKPTSEQLAAVDGFASGENMVISACAGSGKTSTLRLMANSSRKRGLYLAFNKSVQLDAQASFPRSVTAKTSSALSYPGFIKPRHERLDLSMRSDALARYLDAPSYSMLHPDFGSLYFTSVMIAQAAAKTVERFCKSPDDKIRARLVPSPPRGGLGPEWDEYRDVVKRVARKIWKDLVDVDGALPFTFEHGLKMYQLSRPKLRYDYILLDEAQDTNPVVLDIVRGQEAQIIAVGDSAQAIYGWNGAQDAMGEFAADESRMFRLTKSFRFGQDIADRANIWLRLLGEPMQIRGSKKDSWVGAIDSPTAILARTNFSLVDHIIDCQDHGVTVSVNDAVKRNLTAFCFGAKALMDGKPVRGPLSMFTSWDEAVHYAESDEGGDIGSMIKLVQRHGAMRIVAVLKNCLAPGNAGTHVSTAHTAKGLEWSSVQIGGGFTEPSDDPASGDLLSREDAMLAYVAVTRAQDELDDSVLDWADGFTGLVV